MRAYDEIKTHQCATLRGQVPTIIRGKRSDLVEQEKSKYQSSDVNARRTNQNIETLRKT